MNRPNIHTIWLFFIPALTGIIVAFMLETYINPAHWNALIGLFIALTLSFFGSRYLSNQLQVLNTQMILLAQNTKIPERLSSIETLTHPPHYEDIQQLAQSLLSIHQTMKKKAREEEQHHQLLFYDTLTGLANRTKMLRIVQQALDAHKNSDLQMALIKLNINRLNIINDGLGYHIGDQLLIQISQHLQKNTPFLHSIARSADDEFILLLNELPQHAETETLTSAMSLIHQMMLTPFQLGEHSMTVSVSLGATLFPDHQHLFHDAESIFTQAMLALHSAKQQTKTQSSIYHPNLEKRAKQQLIMESQLYTAIEQDHLRLYLQPQVNASGQVISAETLVRWQDPEEGLISPGVFIPVAEQTDLIIELDKWVLKKACQYLKKIQEEDITFGLSINISGKHFAHDSFVDTVCRMIEETGVNPERLILEVTEGVFIADLSSVTEKMNKLIKLGIRFSIDDFGTGYSSLQYLKRLPIHELKIDKSFIDGLPESSEDAALVKTIIAIAQHLGLTLVIEGVEHKEQVEFLCEQGDFIMQGYYFAKPQPADAVLKQISEAYRARQENDKG